MVNSAIGGGGNGPEALPSEILEKSEMPTLVIVGIAMAALGLLVANAALVMWFVVRKRNKGTKARGQYSLCDGFSSC